MRFPIVNVDPDDVQPLTEPPVSTSPMDDLIETWERFQRLSREIEEIGLRFTPKDLLAPDIMRRAYDLLTSDVPIAETFPGTSERVDPPYTPLQVLSLTDGWQESITHQDAEYQSAIAEVHSKLGRHRPRGCRGMTRRGEHCAAWALPYIERPFCVRHASDEEVETNRVQREHEEALLHAALSRIAELRR